MLLFSFWYKIFYILNKEFFLFFQLQLLNKTPLFLQQCFDHNVWNNEKKKKKNTDSSSFNTFKDANLKNLSSFFVMTLFHCVISNFEKKFDRIKYVFKIWLNQSKKSSIEDVRLGSKYASVNITLQSFNLRKIKS